MIHINFNNKIRVLIGIILALTITVFLSSFLFVGNTSQINLGKIKELAAKVKELAQLPTTWINRNKISVPRKDINLTLIPTNKPSNTHLDTPQTTSNPSIPTIVPSLFPQTYATPTLGPDAQVEQLAQGVYRINQNGQITLKIEPSAIVFYKEFTNNDGTTSKVLMYE